MFQYKLNNVSIADYGLIPSQADNSNIAVVGAWDMPARIGKVYHEWPDEDGLEPYLRADEIFFGGRDLFLICLLETPSLLESYTACYELYSDINAFNGLVPLTTEFGTYQVYVNRGIESEYIGDGWCKLKLPFREPVIELTGVIPAADFTEPSIDNISFKSLGIIMLDMKDAYKRPEIKSREITAYGFEGYGTAKAVFREITLKLLIDQPDYSSFEDTIKTLFALFSVANARTIKYDGITRECFLKDGFKLTSMYKQGDGYIATLDIKLCEIRVLDTWNLFTTNIGEVLVDKNGQPLTEIIKKF